MLPAAARLTSSDSFRRCVREGRRAGSRTLVLHLAGPTEPTEAVEERSARVGFVVGKTVGGSVVRNRVRRRLRHLVRDRLAELPPASTLVVRALAAAADASYAELRDDLARCLGRVAPVTSSS
ncbi:MAG: ribonuclease P protein component [Nocardioides sp.]